MAQLIYRGNTQQMAFPLLSTLSSRAVLDPGPDHTYVRGMNAGESVPPDLGIPGAYYCHNVMPSTYGWRAVNYYPITGEAQILPPETETGMWFHRTEEDSSFLQFPVNYTVRSGEFIFGIDSNRTAVWQYIRNGVWRKKLDLNPGSFSVDYITVSQGRIVVKKVSANPAFNFDIMVVSSDFRSVMHRSITVSDGGARWMAMIDTDDIKRIRFGSSRRQVTASSDWGENWNEIGRVPEAPIAVNNYFFRLGRHLIAGPSNQKSTLFNRVMISRDNGRTWLSAVDHDIKYLFPREIHIGGRAANSVVAVDRTSPSDTYVARIENDDLVFQKLEQNGIEKNVPANRAGILTDWYDLYVTQYFDGDYRGFKADQLPATGSVIPNSGPAINLPQGVAYAPFFVAQDRIYRLDRNFTLPEE